MARLAHVVVLVTRTMSPSATMRARTLFGDDDYGLYRDLLSTHCAATDFEVWAWCLDAHGHLILVSSDADVSKCSRGIAAATDRQATLHGVVFDILVRHRPLGRNGRWVTCPDSLPEATSRAGCGSAGRSTRRGACKCVPIPGQDALWTQPRRIC